MLNYKTDTIIKSFINICSDAMLQRPYVNSETDKQSKDSIVFVLIVYIAYKFMYVILLQSKTFISIM